MKNQFWLLDDINLFNVMCPNKLKARGDNSPSIEHYKRYSKGETVYFTDDPSTTMYLIAQGKVRILNYTENGDEVVRAILGKGEMFGELALLGEDKRTEIAEAMDDETTLCPLKVDQVFDLMKDNQEFTFKIYKWLGFRLKKLERRIDNLVFKDVRSRLMDFIKELAVEKGEQEGSLITVKHFYTHKNIANLIGTSRQTVTTTLNELREEKLIDFDRKSITVKNIAAF